MRWLMRALTRTYLVGLFNMAGVENVPRTGPLIVCPNHSATLDPPMVPAFLPRSDSWSMAKSEFFKRGFLTWLFRSYHAFPVVRHSADRTALRTAFEILNSRHALIIYPEGTRVESGVLAQPEPGAGFIAQKAGCPVVPVGLTGTREQGGMVAEAHTRERHLREAVHRPVETPRWHEDHPRGGIGRDHARDRRAAARAPAGSVSRPGGVAKAPARGDGAGRHLTRKRLGRGSWGGPADRESAWCWQRML